MVRTDCNISNILLCMVRNRKTPIFQKMGKKSLEKYFHKIKKGHF
jgi:hypothetical protein